MYILAIHSNEAVNKPIGRLGVNCLLNWHTYRSLCLTEIGHLHARAFNCRMQRRPLSRKGGKTGGFFRLNLLSGRQEHLSGEELVFPLAIII